MCRLKTKLIFDGQCPFCVRQVFLLQKLDWLQRVTPKPIQSLASAEREFLPDEEVLMGAVHCSTPSGSVLSGAACFRHVCLRVPLLVPLGLLLFIPGLMPVAHRVYAWVSRNRQALSRRMGWTETCDSSPVGRESRTGRCSPGDESGE